MHQTPTQQQAHINTETWGDRDAQGGGDPTERLLYKGEAHSAPLLYADVYFCDDLGIVGPPWTGQR